MARRNWLNSLKRSLLPGGALRRNAVRRRRSERSQVAGLEKLEDRVMLTANLWIDFGDGLPAGGLSVSNADAVSISAKQVAKDRSTPILLESLGTVVREHRVDFDGDGSSNLSDYNQIKNSILEIVRRQYESFDVRVRVASASSVQDVIDTLAANDATSSDFDAYVLVMKATDSDDGGSVADRRRDRGVTRVEAGTGVNSADDAPWVFADFWGTESADELTDSQFAVAFANIISHEAGHSFGLPHWDNGSGGATTTEQDDLNAVVQSEMMAQGGGDNDEFRLTESRIFTRYDMPKSDELSTVLNAHDLLAGAGSVGLKANAPAHITGTGAHDIVTITNNGDGTAHIVVEAFRDAAHTDPIASRNSITNPYEYDVSLANGLVIELGFGDDVVELDASLNAPVTIRGGADKDTIALTTTPGQTVTVDTAGGLILDGDLEIANFVEVEHTIHVEAAGLYVVDEGSAVQLTARGFRSDTTSRPVSWVWDLDNDGIFGETGTDASNGDEVGRRVWFEANVDGGAGGREFPVSAQATDANGATTRDTARVVVRNVNPELTSVSITPEIDEGGVVVVTGSFVDPGTNDVHTLRVDWGDGEMEDITLPVNDRSFAVSHRYLEDGEYTVSAAIADRDTRIVTIQPIQMFDDNGENGASVDLFEAETDKIWAQAGIDMQFLSLGSLNETDFLDIADSTEFDLLRTTPGNGQHTDPTVINMWFVNDLALGSGIGIVDDNGIAIDQDVLNNNNIQAVAHELGHNLGLGHSTFGAGGPENLMTTNAAGKIQPDSIDDIYPHGDLLSQLTPDQIAEALNSPFLRTMPVAENAFTVTVNNVRPEITSLDVNKTLLNEGETVTLRVAFTDPGLLDSHDAIIRWGDGKTDVVSLNGERFLVINHDYASPGSYRIRVRVSDDDGATSPRSTVDVEVNALPVAANDTVQAAEDVPVNIDVLANDTDADGDPLTIVGAVAVNGSVVVEEDGTLTFTPELNFNGLAKIVYQIGDGRGGFDTAEVYIQVLSPAQQLLNLRADVKSLVDSGVLNTGQGNSLLNKLEPKGSPGATLNSLRTFAEQVRQFVEYGILSREDGLRLVGAVLDIRTGLLTR